jgi:hypothetical protein
MLPSLVVGHRGRDDTAECGGRGSGCLALFAPIQGAGCVMKCEKVPAMVAAR